MYDFMMSAFHWIVMGVVIAIACANGNKIKLLWEKWEHR